MEDAHVDAVMILGDVFRHPGEFNFAVQDTTSKITHLVPTMMEHRLCPPPEEVYSLHRKLSGVFLSCVRNLKFRLPFVRCFWNSATIMKKATSHDNGLLLLLYRFFKFLG